MLRPFTHFACFGLLSALLTRPSLAAPTSGDPCEFVAGKAFVDPADALACLKSFPFNETLRQNILSVVSRVFDFYTFEIFYSESPPPFEDSTRDIRGQIQRINSTQYETDYDFNRDLYDFINQMNDGHTLWLPYCYFTYNNLLPAPIVLLDNGVFIVPDSEKLFDKIGSGFTSFLAEKGFDWKRLAGAEVIEIDGLPVLDYIDKIARTVTGTYLDHNVRVNSVVSSYRIVGSEWSQRFGDHASELFLKQTSLDMLLIPNGSTSPEMVNVPFVAEFVGNDFADGSSYWANNCAATNTTNGVDRSSDGEISERPPLLTRAELAETVIQPNSAVGLPDPYIPTLEPTKGSAGPIKSYILPGKRTGVMFVGSFAGDIIQSQVDIAAAFDQFSASGVTNLVIDVTDNGGGYVCLGLFLHQYLAGMTSGIPGFESASRANPLAQKIVETNIARHIPNELTFYGSSNWLFMNGTRMPEDYDYNNPSTEYDINDQNQPTSQRFTDLCPRPPRGITIPSSPPFDLNNVVIIGNGNCASTCALFTTLMYELHGTKIATFGGHLDQSMQYKGMAGNQVLEWSDLDSEIKTAGLKDDPLAPPDLLVNGNMRHNWRSAYSWSNENLPIAYVSEEPQYRIAYTKETYNRPQKVWTFVERTFFGDE